MLDNNTISKLHEMNLSIMAAAFQNQLGKSSIAEMSFEERFGLMVDAEWTARKNNRMKRLIRNADYALPNACLEDIEYHADRRLDKTLIGRLSSCNYVQECHNVIILGATGSGKTFVSNALGMTANRNFYTVRYVRLPDLLADLTIARAEGNYRKIMKDYKQVKLLILDEWLLYPLKESEARDLLEIAESRYKKASTIFCSQYDRTLLKKLSQCAWKILSCYLEKGVVIEDPIPGAVIAAQTFGDFLNFNPHLHIISTDGCFSKDGSFMRAVVPNAAHLEPLFRLEVLKMLKREGKITDAVIENMDTWHHSGFHVYCGDVIQPDDEEGLERLARYIIRAPISQERILYVAASETRYGISQVIYTGKNSSLKEQFTALDWLARLVTHIPNKGEQLVRYYGFYSNKARGVRKKVEAEKAEGLETSTPVHNLIENSLSRKTFRRNWARLIKKIYHADPLLCTKCNGTMRIISFIEEEAAIKKILKHLNLWMPNIHDPPEPNKGVAGTRFSYILEINLDASLQVLQEEIISHIPYEDDYSQLTPYDDDCIGL